MALNRTDPEVAALLDTLKASVAPGTPRLWDLDPPAARVAATEFFAPFNAGGPVMAQTRDVTIPGRHRPIRGRVYVPPDIDTPSPGLLYLHGGGFVIGSPETHDRLTRDLAVAIGARVISLDYALAPEYPYPAGLDDCVDAARWLGSHASTLGIDSARLLIGGDSAGANLSAATLLRLRNEPETPAFRAALLIYGRFVEGETPSLTAWGDRDLVLSRRLMDWFHSHYVSGGAMPGDPHIAPALGDVSQFPPTILIVGTLDPLRSDSEMFAVALGNAGVPVELHVVPDGIHAFVQMPMLTMARTAIAQLGAFARRALTPRTRA
jgi:acetyl esterase